MKKFSPYLLILWLLATCFITGCGSDYPDSPVHDPVSSTGSVRGIVTNAVTNQPISSVTVSTPGVSETLQVTTQADGSYFLQTVPVGSFVLTFSSPGFSTQQQTVSILNGQETIFNLAMLPLGAGTVSGQVTDAVSGLAVANATITSGALTTTSDAGGNYTLTNLAIGQATVTAAATGFTNSTAVLQIVADQGATQNFVLSPTLVVGAKRFVLTWGEQVDLDLQLYLPPATPFQVFYRERGLLDAFPFASLDHDDTDTLGPETITVTQSQPGTYQLRVYAYTGPTSFAGAKMQVFDSSGLVQTVDAPSDTGLGWNVLSFDGTTGAITVINQVTAAFQFPAGYGGGLAKLLEPK